MRLCLFLIFVTAVFSGGACGIEISARVVGADTGRPMYVVDAFLGAPPRSVTFAVDFTSPNTTLFLAAHRSSATLVEDAEMICFGADCVSFDVQFVPIPPVTPPWIDGFIGFGVGSPLWKFWPRVEITRFGLDFKARGEPDPDADLVLRCAGATFCEEVNSGALFFNNDGYLYVSDGDIDGFYAGIGSVYDDGGELPVVCFDEGCLYLEWNDVVRAHNGVKSVFIRPTGKYFSSAFNGAWRVCSNVPSVPVSLLLRYRIMRDFESGLMWMYREYKLPLHRSDLSLFVLLLLVVLYVRSLTAYLADGSVARLSPYDLVADAVAISTLAAVCTEQGRYAHADAAAIAAPWIVACYAVGQYTRGYAPADYAAFAAAYAREMCIVAAAWVVSSEVGPSHRFVLSCVMASVMIYYAALFVFRFAISGSLTARDAALFLCQLISAGVLADAGVRRDITPFVGAWHTTMAPIRDYGVFVWVTALSALAGFLACTDAQVGVDKNK